MTPEAAPAPWRNRIVGSGEEAPDQLVANPLNWRTHPGPQRDALRGSLSEIGWVQQVMVNRRTGFVVDGHARVEEAISAGAKTVPVLYVDLSDEEERLILATLDPIGAMAQADSAKLDELLAELNAGDPGLQALLDSLGTPKLEAGLTDPDDVPPLAETFIKAGDLFALGDHRLLCGDATNARDVAWLMDGAIAECMWTDPPYGVDYVGKTARALRIANDGAESGPAVFAGACRVAPLAPSSPFYVAVPAGPRQLDFLLALREAGWRLHQELVWVKNSIVLGHSDYHYRHEPILYGYTPGPGRPGRGAHPGTRWCGDNAASSVLEYDKPAKSVEHPTMKPVGLVEECLANSTHSDDRVYEPFAGSGSALIAAQRLGRRCYAIEIDPRYVAVSIKRWEQFTGRQAEQING
jgi:DNA modification methylase